MGHNWKGGGIWALGSLALVIGMLSGGSVAAREEVVPGCVAAVEKANGHYVKCALKHEASFTIHGNEAKRDKKLEICRGRFVRRIGRAIGKYGDESCTKLSVEAMQIEADEFIRQAVEGANGTSTDDKCGKYLISWPEGNYPRAAAALNKLIGHGSELRHLRISSIRPWKSVDHPLIKKKREWLVRLKKIVENYGGTLVENIPLVMVEDFVHSSPSVIPNDQLLNFESDFGSGSAYHLKPYKEPAYGMNAYGAWEHQTDCSSIRTMMIDSGVDLGHPDLKANLWNNQKELDGIPEVDDDNNGYVDDYHGWDVENNTNLINEVEGQTHGTSVAGLIGAVGNNVIGSSGVCQKAEIVTVRWRFNKSECRRHTLGGFLEAMDYALASGVKIINQSQGWYCQESSEGGLTCGFDHNPGGNVRAQMEMASRAVAKVVAAGVLFFTSFGNKGWNTDEVLQRGFPQSFDGVYGVAATDGPKILEGSNYGTEADFAAPGAPMRPPFTNGVSFNAGWAPMSDTFGRGACQPWTNDPNLAEGCYRIMGQTSMASALVTATAALVWAANSSLSPVDVIEILRSTGNYSEALVGKTRDARVIDAGRAVAKAVQRRSQTQ